MNQREGTSESAKEIFTIFARETKKENRCLERRLRENSEEPEEDEEDEE